MTIKTHTGRKLFKRSTIAACVMAATAAHVQAQEANSDDPALLEEVVVYGIKQSLQDAQGIKRDAATVKDVITASDISALPDKSVVEALQRLPGVSIDKFAASDDPDHFSAEGSGVVVRGLNRTRSEFNGRDSFSANRSNGLNFSDVPPELMGSVEVVKNTTADMIEGGISGTINLMTRKPFDADDMQLAGSVKASYGDKINDTSPSFSGLYSNRWDVEGGELGFLLNVSKSDYTMRSDGAQVFNYYERSDKFDADADQAIGEPIAGRENDVLIMPPAANIRIQETDRSRLGFATSLQWADTDETILATAEFIRSDSDLTWNEHFVEFSDQAFENARANNASLVNTDASNAANISGVNSFDSNGAFTHGILTGLKYVNGIRVHAETSTIDDSSLNLKFTPNDNLTVIADLQYIDAKATNVDNTVHTISETDTYLDTRGDIPQINYLAKDWSINEGRLATNNNASLEDAANVTFRSMMDHISESEGQSLAFKLDGEYTFDDGFITSVKAGVRISDKEQNIAESDYNWGNISQEWNDTAAKCSEYQELCEYFDFGSNFHNGDVLTGQTGFWFPKIDLGRDSVLLDEYVLENGIHAQNDSAGRENLRDRDGVIVGSPYLPTEIYNVQQKREAVYVRADFALDDLAMPIKGNFGLRYVGYDLESTGGSNFGEFSDQLTAADSYTSGEVEIPQSDLDFANGAAGVISTVKAPKYTKVLPSFNVTLEATDDLLFRFAFSQGIYLPDLADVRNNFNISANASTTPDPLPTDGTYDTVTVSPYTVTDVGNPLLTPEESTNIDLTAEWYFSDVGSVTFSAFMKDLKDIHRKQSFVIDVTNPSNGATKPVIASGTRNSGDAEITGFELAYQQTFDMLPGAWSGLGVQFNYTFIDAEQTSENEPLDPSDAEYTFRSFNNLPLEGLSEDTFNFVVFYENDAFSTRLAYNWRSDYLLNSRDVITFSPIYSEATGTLDGSFHYNVNDTFKVGVEVNNLLDSVTETQIQYDQAGTLTPRSYFVQDRRVSLVLQASF